MTVASVGSPWNAMDTVAGFANVNPSGEKEKIGERASYPAGGGSCERTMPIVVGVSRAPAGTARRTPSTSTEPPAGPTSPDELSPADGGDPLLAEVLPLSHAEAAAARSMAVAERNASREMRTSMVTS